jgi:hypothetical protein
MQVLVVSTDACAGNRAWGRSVRAGAIDAVMLTASAAPISWRLY